MTELTMTRTVKSRKSYEAKSGITSRAALTLIGAAFGDKPVFTEDDNGNMVREWKKSEMMSFTTDDLRNAICNRVAVETNEMLGTVSPSAIKYMVTKGWLVAHSSDLFFVTKKAWIELDLPSTFKGGANHGRKIRFAA